MSGYDRKKVDKQFKRLGISLPMCFIGGTPIALLATAEIAAEIDRFVIAVD